MDVRLCKDRNNNRICLFMFMFIFINQSLL